MNDAFNDAVEEDCGSVGYSERERVEEVRIP